MGIEDGFYLLIEIVVNERWGIKRELYYETCMFYSDSVLEGATGIPTGLQAGVGAQAPGYQHQIPVVLEPVVQPPQVPAQVVGVPAALEVALADDNQCGSFQTIVSSAREAEFLEQDDFGGPKRVRIGGQYSGTSSGGRGPTQGRRVLPASKASTCFITSYRGWASSPSHLIRQCPHQTQSGPHRTISAVPERDSAPLVRGRGRG
ncbi:hypothetical protein H5410_015345 [Solanum commersonii]|uniref:Uncharacterized protein n=1 Tax=Solanum commersonii TaxID=4109 RepID=A0A9J5ZTI3_SOLCO|nr:hypothetical protein H5410_015345 [Solanum commersonii]